MSQIKRSFNDDTYTIVYPVTEKEHGIRLDQFLKDHFSSFSREFIKKKIEKKEVIVTGLKRSPPHKPSIKLSKGEEVTLTFTKQKEEEEFWNGKKVPLEYDPPVIFEDDFIIVISKPPFMTVHPSGRHLFHCATTYFQKIHKKLIHSIHRIDRETSGILLLGKDTKMTMEISQMFESGKIKKCYFLIGKKNKHFKTSFPFTASESLKPLDILPTIKSSTIFMQACPQGDSEAKPSETLFELLAENDTYLLALAFPKTGRQHQIRVHAAHHGFPLLGDKLYSGDAQIFSRHKDGLATDSDCEELEIPRHALHAIAIHFSYQGKMKTFMAPLPLDLKIWLQEKKMMDENFLQQKIEDSLKNYFL
ncbi:MAG: RluA family pseudouridine synthase [Bacteriovoracaceae bacterium]|nr:RluA family pseudouridine synthase [Bacteriovoracaceae bacterium]